MIDLRQNVIFFFKNALGTTLEHGIYEFDFKLKSIIQWDLLSITQMISDLPALEAL